MKYILILDILFNYGCKEAYPKTETVKIDDRKVDKDWVFIWTLHKFNDYNNKVQRYMIPYNHDSVIYYIAKMEAYNEMGEYIKQLKK